MERVLHYINYTIATHIREKFKCPQNIGEQYTDLPSTQCTHTYYNTPAGIVILYPMVINSLCLP